MAPSMEQILQALAQTSESLATLTALQQKTITGTPTAQLMHGATGLFSVLGMDDVVINASLTPEGIDRVIPAFPTVYTDPRYTLLTGFEPDSRGEPTGVCDDCPGGIMETCTLTATFGRICRESQEIEINSVFSLLNRGETTPLRLMGQVLGDSSLIPQGLDRQGWLDYVTRSQMVIVGNEFQQALMPMVWTGNPANNLAGGGYMEFPGFDMLINTGKVDISGATCPGIDPDIKDFNFGDVCGDDPDIVEVVSMLEFFLRHVATRTHLMPVEWVLAMRPELFWELTACWPCKYLTNRCLTTYGPGTQVSVINDDSNVAMRDAMRNGNYLLVNGRQIPVVLDDGIFEENSTTSAQLAAGEFASDIYMIPLKAKNMTVTYFEYLDYRMAGPDIQMLRGREDFWPTDDGRYMWTLLQQMWCFAIAAKIEPRLILRTPHLAGRIMNVRYSPLQHLRSPFADSPYFAKGGVETQPAPSVYSEWNLPA